MNKIKQVFLYIINQKTIEGSDGCDGCLEIN
jgi:hypothetical protein